jgi:hypothetical protein
MTGTKRRCNKGHIYFKSIDYPVCPVCEEERKPDKGFLTLLSAPAGSALEYAGVKTLKQLSALSE